MNIEIRNTDKKSAEVENNAHSVKIHSEKNNTYSVERLVNINELFETI